MSIRTDVLLAISVVQVKLSIPDSFKSFDFPVCKFLPSRESLMTSSETWQLAFLDYLSKIHFLKLEFSLGHTRKLELLAINCPSDFDSLREMERR